MTPGRSEIFPCFNSRTLGRVRLRSTKQVELIVEFQFTHPGKGATDLFEIVGKYVPVSIHAPWEGCDSSDFCTKELSGKFQFTHPGKGATSIERLSSVEGTRFQFTHPGKGATY